MRSLHPKHPVISKHYWTPLNEAKNIVITRGGQRIAAIIPAPASNGAALNNVITKWRDCEALDETFGESVETARAAATTEKDTDPWSG